jgi:hypothetical protein
MGGGKHRLEQTEVRGRDRDLGGDDDLLLVGDGLGVVALKPAAGALDQPRIQVGGVDRALRRGGRRVGLGLVLRAEPPAVAPDA